MIYREVIRSLSEKELMMLGYVLNFIHPRGENVETSEEILSSYKKDAVLQICAHYRDRVKEENLPTYDDMLAKINGSYKPRPELQPSAPETGISDEHDNQLLS